MNTPTDGINQNAREETIQNNEGTGEKHESGGFSSRQNLGDESSGLMKEGLPETLDIESAESSVLTSASRRASSGNTLNTQDDNTSCVQYSFSSDDKRGGVVELLDNQEHSAIADVHHVDLTEANNKIDKNTLGDRTIDKKCLCRERGEFKRPLMRTKRRRRIYGSEMFITDGDMQSEHNIMRSQSDMTAQRLVQRTNSQRRLSDVFSSEVYRVRRRMSMPITYTDSPSEHDNYQSDEFENKIIEKEIIKNDLHLVRNHGSDINKFSNKALDTACDKREENRINDNEMMSETDDKQSLPGHGKGKDGKSNQNGHRSYELQGNFSSKRYEVSAKREETYINNHQFMAETDDQGILPEDRKRKEKSSQSELDIDLDLELLKMRETIAKYGDEEVRENIEINISADDSGLAKIQQNNDIVEEQSHSETEQVNTIIEDIIYGIIEKVTKEKFKSQPERPRNERDKQETSKNNGNDNRKHIYSANVEQTIDAGIYVCSSDGDPVTAKQLQVVENSLHNDYSNVIPQSDDDNVYNMYNNDNNSDSADDGDCEDIDNDEIDENDDIDHDNNNDDIHYNDEEGIEVTGNNNASKDDKDDNENKRSKQRDHAIVYNKYKNENVENERANQKESVCSTEGYISPIKIDQGEASHRSKVRDERVTFYLDEQNDEAKTSKMDDEDYSLVLRSSPVSQKEQIGNGCRTDKETTFREEFIPHKERPMSSASSRPETPYKARTVSSSSIRMDSPHLHRTHSTSSSGVGTPRNEKSSVTSSRKGTPYRDRPSSVASSKNRSPLNERKASATSSSRIGTPFHDNFRYEVDAREFDRHSDWDDSETEDTFISDLDTPTSKFDIHFFKNKNDLDEEVISCIIRARDDEITGMLETSIVDPLDLPSAVGNHEVVLSYFVKLSSSNIGQITSDDIKTIGIPYDREEMTYYHEPILRALNENGQWTEITYLDTVYHDGDNMSVTVLETDHLELTVWVVTARPIIDHVFFNDESNEATSSTDSDICLSVPPGSRYNPLNMQIELQVIPISTDVLEEAKVSANDDMTLLFGTSSLITVDLEEDPSQPISIYIPCNKPYTRPQTGSRSSSRRSASRRSATLRLGTADSGYRSTSRLSSGKLSLSSFNETRQETENHLVRFGGGLPLKHKLIKPKEINKQGRIVCTVLEKNCTCLIMEGRKYSKTPDIQKVITCITNVLEFQKVQVCVIQSKFNVRHIRVSCTLKSHVDYLHYHNLEREHYLTQNSFRLKEGDVIRMCFRGNIIPVKDDNKVFRFYGIHGFNTEWNVAIVDIYSQRSLQCFCGFIQIFKWKSERKFNMLHPDIKDSRHWHLVTEVPVTLPKTTPHLTPFTSRAPVRIKGEGPITVEYLLSLANRIGDEWPQLARSLRIEHARLQSIIQQNHNNMVANLVADILLAWLKRSPHSKDKATILSHALKTCGRRDLSDEIRGKDRIYKLERSCSAKETRIENAILTVTRCPSATTKWRPLAHGLGLSENDVKDIEHVYSDENQRCEQMLNLWKHKETEYRLKTLVRSLRHVGCKIVADHLELSRK